MMLVYKDVNQFYNMLTDGFMANNLVEAYLSFCDPLQDVFCRFS